MRSVTQFTAAARHTILDGDTDRLSRSIDRPHDRSNIVSCGGHATRPVLRQITPEDPEITIGDADREEGR